MSEKYYIAKHPQLEPSQDYAALRSEGIAHIERLAHRLWTDYNIHDPGITVLELLCYAITDLGYRASYPIEDLLTREQAGVIESLGDFHSARQVMTCNPVTFDDLAKLVVDVPGVRNAWVKINRDESVCLQRSKKRLVQCEVPNEGQQILNGLYDVYLEYEDRVRESSDPHHIGPTKNLPGQGGYIATGRAGIQFDCEYPLRLQSVSVYAQAAGKVVVRLTNRLGNVLSETEEVVNQAHKKTAVALGFDVPVGKGYRLDAHGSAVKLYRNKPVPGTLEYPMDLERLISLRNGFNASTDKNDIYYFFYDWVITYDRSSGTADQLPRDVQLTRNDVDRAVRQRLQQHRNLCEDPVRLCKLVPEEVAVCADLELNPGTDAEQVLSEIFVQLRQHVSPPVRFRSLQEMLEMGRRSEEIFAGPALDHGFIDDEEFTQRRRRCEIRASDVIRIILDVEGVIAVHNLKLLAFDQGATEPHTQDDWLLPLSDEHARAPVFKWERSKIVFYQNQLPYYPDRERVSVLLRERRQDDIRRRMQTTEEPHDLPVPVGVDRAPADFLPLQNELPMTYRVGSYRVPDSEPPLRHAQARQFKAYLMFFEQLLANYLSQLQRMYELFSWQPGHTRTYFTQLVSGIHGLDDLFMPDFADDADRYAELQVIVEDDETASSRRNRFLDHLLGRFCEDFTDYSLLLYGLYGETGTAGRLIADKRAFLAEYPLFSSGRGRAHDYRYPQDPHNLSGYQQRLYRLLGFPEMQRRDLAGHELKVTKTASNPARPWQFRLRLGGQMRFESRGCENRESAEVLLDLALQLAGEHDNYTASADVHELVMVCADDEEPRLLGRTTTGTDLNVVVDYFADLAQARGFHLIEHILLRPRGAADPLLPVQLDEGADCPCVEVTDPYSFRMSIILPSWPTEFQDTRFRSFVEDTIRREAPAQVIPRVCWISHAQMQDFERHYRAWEESLAQIAAAEPACDGEPPAVPLRAEYATRLGGLIDAMYQLNNVHPLAQLHDCGSTRGETPRVFLDHSNLGTF
jgi:hypothetical protein